MENKTVDQELNSEEVSKTEEETPNQSSDETPESTAQEEEVVEAPSEEKKPRKAKQKVKKKTVIITSCVGVFVCVVGAITGVYLGGKFSTHGPDYSKFAVEDYDDDAEVLYSKYNSLSPSQYQSNLTVSEMANIAMYKYSLNEYTHSDLTGEAKAMGVSQIINGKSIRNNEIFFNESISTSSFVKAAKRMYEYRDQDEVTTYSGSPSSNGDSAYYSGDSYETLTLKEHEDKWGRTIDRVSIYIISSYTVLDTSSCSIDGDGNYVLDINLNPVLAVLRYVKQMKSMSGYDEPYFDYINMKLTLSPSLDLIEMDIHEVYYVEVIGSTRTEAHVNEKFYVDETAYSIPAVTD